MPPVLHADMDAFFAAIEQRDDPQLRGRPVVVGGATGRGVVTSASYEARVFGIRSAMPSAHARRLCPDLVFARGRMAHYRAESRRIFEIFRRYTPAVEPISVDEAFLDLAGTEKLLGPAAEVGERLRAEVRAETGLAVSVGIAPVKMVAKIASGRAKPDGLLEIAPHEVRAFLDPLPVRSIWGIGPVAAARLEQLGIATIGELSRRDEALLARALGSFAANAARLARGEDARPVEPDRSARSISEENTFARDVASRRRLEATIRSHSESLARRLRRSDLVGRCVTLKLKLARPLGGGRYPQLTRSRTLESPTDDGATIARVGRALLARADLGESVRLLGVAVSRLEPTGDTSARDAQLSLLDGAIPEPLRRARLNHALDEIQGRFGRDALSLGGGETERAGLSSQIKRGE